MAAPTGGGGKFTIIEKKFDINTATLSEVVDMYVKQAIKNKPSFDGKIYRATFNSKPYIRDFMNKPVIEFLDAATNDEINPLIRVYDESPSIGGRRKYYSAFKGIEENVTSQVARSTGKELSYYKANGIPKLTNTVILDAKPGARSAKFAFNHLKAGEFQLALLEHAKNNPKDVPVVRATLAMLHTGFRTNEIQKMPMDALKPAIEGSIAPGIFIGASKTKMDFNIDIPASSKLQGILSSSVESNKRRFGDLSKVENFMFLKDDGKPLAENAINELLKKIKVKGIMQNKETGEMLDYFTSSYDLRRYNSTVGYKLNIPLPIMAKMKGRAISASGAAGEVLYPSPMTGLYSAEDLKYHEILSEHMSSQLDNSLRKKGLLGENLTLASDQDLVTNYINKDNPLEPSNIKTVESGSAQKFSTTTDLSNQEFIVPELDESNIIDGDYEIIDPDNTKNLPSSFEDFSAEEIAELNKIGINTSEPTTTKIQKIKKGTKKALETVKKTPLGPLVAPALFGMLLPDELSAAEKRYDSPDAGFIRSAINQAGGEKGNLIKDVASAIEGTAVAAGKALDPGFELGYDFADKALFPDDSERALREYQQFRDTDTRPKDSSFMTSTDKLKARREGRGFIDRQQNLST